jgi:hypothetical protein
VETAQQHLAVLGRSLPEALAAYRELSLAGANIALTAGRLDGDQHERLSAALASRV